MTAEYDVIVVGAGAGGATVARETARRGWKTLLLERGGRVEWLGDTTTVARGLRRFGLTRSREGNTVVFADNYGGMSLLAAGCAVPPPKAMFAAVGVDLAAETEEARRELGIRKLPDELLGPANRRLLEAANDAGFHWEKMDKFIDPARCRPDCADCMLGCPTGAKWTARVYGDEAAAWGADLALRTAVRDVIVEGGRAVGVAARRWGTPVRYYGKLVVLAGGADNVPLLRRAGVNDAGRGFCCDWLQFVGGVVPGLNTATAHPMAVGTTEHYESEGLIVLPVFPNWSQFAVMLAMGGPRRLRLFPNFWKYTGLMVKIRDEMCGELCEGGAFSKPVSANDRRRLARGVEIIKQVLRRAGAKGDFVVLPPSGAHPSAVCRIGETVDADLQTRIDRLYCCDASVLPASLGAPVIWTAVALGKRLAKRLHARLAGAPGSAA